MFYDRFAQLCNQKGVAPSFVVQEIGLSKPNATFWKNGSIPKGSTLKKLADYFGVPVDYFFSEDEKKEVEDYSEGFAKNKVLAETKSPEEIRGMAIDTVLGGMEYAEINRVEELANKQIVKSYRSISDEELEEEMKDCYRYLNRLGRITLHMRITEMVEFPKYKKGQEEN